MIKLVEFCDKFAHSGRFIHHEWRIVITVCRSADGLFLCYESFAKPSFAGGVLYETPASTWNCGFVDLHIMLRQIDVLVRRFRLRRHRNRLPYKYCWLPASPLRYFGMIGQCFPGLSKGKGSRLMFFYEPEQQHDIVTIYVDGFDVERIRMTLLFQLHDWLTTQSTGNRRIEDEAD